MQPGMYHVPVLLDEVIGGLQIAPSGTYVDCTFGGGGHSMAILERLGKEGKLIVFDQDQDARKNVPDDARVTFVPHNFRHLKRFLRLHKIVQVHGILADLGVSSHQFDTPERGFSTRFNGSMDMRMDTRQEFKASEVIKTYTEARLHKLFEQYGEVTNSKTLAKTIVQLRGSVPMDSISQFKSAINGIVKGNPNKYFAQVFQALRIEVNDEFGALKEMLLQVEEVLLPGGRIAVITFHSIEDRIVKNFFKAGSFNVTETDEIYGSRQVNPFNLITKKPVIASAEELKKNVRSGSAKLRIAEKK